MSDAMFSLKAIKADMEMCLGYYAGEEWQKEIIISCLRKIDLICYIKENSLNSINKRV